ncbi:MAG: hypothetical protein RMH84_01045 [Sulfolobales archaeon]|nr:hypothetical protein [Sulfolobales archaeon]MCX8208556.1 hypothetical protein [Sulfolobales archaeon]MDW8010172.1 hypothetical protein [Sulfolobales archaeon]
MYRAVYDALLRGLPEEVACLAKLGEHLFSRGFCVGTHTSFICSYGGSLVKVSPQVVRPQYIVHELAHAGTVKIVVESSNHEFLVSVVSDIYRTLKECGVVLKLIPE